MICMLKAIYYCYLNVFENFRRMCLKIYKLDPAKLLNFWISMGGSFKKKLK